MKMKFVGMGSYYAHPFHFTENNRVHEVDNKLGEYLLESGKFEEVKSEPKKAKTEKKTEKKEEPEKEEKKSTKK